MKLVFAVALALATLLGTADARPLATFRRGVSVHTMLNWARLAPGDPNRYAADPFAGPDYELSDVVIDNVRAAGFDFVRLTIDPGPFLQLRREPRAALDRKMVATIRRFLGHDLAVMVDLHSNSHVPAYDPEKWLTSTEDPTFQAYLALIEHTSSLLARLGTKAVAMEPINEPVYGYDPASVTRWQTMAEMMHAAVRRAAPDLLVVISGAQGGSRHGLEALDPRPFEGSRVLFSFHYYEPYVFTHEGVVSSQENARLWRYFSSMPYPAGDASPARVLDTVTANIDSDPDIGVVRKRLALHAAQSEVESYIASGFDRRTIESAFDGVQAWARRYRVDPKRIFLGEFGVTRTYGGYRAADPKFRAAWLRDVRRAAETRGFGWCLWSLSGYGGMALVADDHSDALDPTTLKALGLRNASSRPEPVK